MNILMHQFVFQLLTPRKNVNVVAVIQIKELRNFHF